MLALENLNCKQITSLDFESKQIKNYLQAANVRFKE
jgi:hypothetical protein